MPFSASSDQIVGEFDLWNRPVLQLQLMIAGASHNLTCTIDTGCDDPMVFRSLQHALTIGLQFRTAPRDRRHLRLLADGTERRFVEAGATLRWFAEDRAIKILAPDPLEPNLPTVLDPNVPAILIGVPILSGCLIQLDLRTTPGCVTITGPTAGGHSTQT